MSLAIALTNHQGKHAGFILLADIAEDYRQRPGEWQGKCIFMALPAEPSMLSDSAYLELADLADRKHQGEHLLQVANDGTAVSLVAADSRGECFYAKIPQQGQGEWGTIRGNTRAQLGRAIFTK